MRHLSQKLTVAAAVALLTFGGSVLAVSPNANVHAQEAGQPTGSPNANVKTDKSDRQAAAAEKREARLADAKLKVCEKREQKINNIMARTVDRATKQIAVFDKIATRTKDFYTSKGRTVANYDALVAAVDTAKQKAETDLATMKTTATFDCSSTDPKGSAAAFKTNLKLVIADLKAYKTAVKNLIVGVKSAQGAASSGKSSPQPSSSVSPSPSASPSATPTPSPTTSPDVNNGANQ